MNSPRWRIAIAGATPFALIGITVLALSAHTTRPASASPSDAADARDTIAVGVLTRYYIIHDFSQGTRAPVVILLHGGGGNAERMANKTQFDVIARREHLIAVYPDGTGGDRASQLLTWNATHCCAAAMRNHVDDVGFISALIDRLVATGHADPTRVYVTGMSNGAMMTHVIGRELSHKVAAIATNVGALFGDEPPPQAPVSALIIVGQLDARVPGAGGPIAADLVETSGSGLRGRLMARRAANNPVADRDVAPAIAQATYWSHADGCTDSTTTVTPAAKHIAYTGCRDGTDVQYYVVTGSGHAWPGGRAGRDGGDPTATTFNASEVIWAFFSTHKRAH